MSTIPELQLALMGGLQFTLGDTEITDQISTKGQALLCFLATTKRPQSRPVIAELLWGDKPEADARRSLRVELTKLRQVLDNYLLASRQSLAFDLESRYWSDIEAFENYLNLSRQPNNHIDPAPLREAVKLYRGDFLAGFDARDATSFGEWMLAQRERLHQMAINSLDSLVEHYIAQRSFAEGIEYANQLLALDPWRDTAHRQLMWLLAYSGQRNAALAQFESCRRILAEELAVEPLPETVALYHEIRDMVTPAAPKVKVLPPLPETTSTSNPFHVPASVPNFTGREHEIAMLSERLCAPGAQTRIALIGMGGVGKTSISLQLAHRLRDQFPDGVLWAHVATDDPNAIIENWAEAYGYDFSSLPDLESKAAALQRVLTEKHALLILDDVTHAARIRPLLPDPTTRSMILFTMRNADLAYTLGAESIFLSELETDEARRLLVRIIGEERAAQEETAVTEICHLLQNLPLAVTIAAQRLASRPRRHLADFVARLRNETNRLAELKESDHAVRASFAISWQALDQIQKQIFSLLAVFDGRAFTAEALASIAEIDRYGAMDRLDSLVALSLLNEEGDQYYRQHALLADFAREQVADMTPPLQRMAQYYLDYATNYRHDYTRLRPEWENLAAGIRNAYDLQMWNIVIDYTQALHHAWLARGRYTEAQQAHKQAIEAAKMQNNQQALAYSLLRWGETSLEKNDHAETHDLLLRSAQLFQKLQDNAGLASAYYYQARLAIEAANYEQAETLLKQSQQLREALHDNGGVAEILHLQARLAFRKGLLDKAEEQAQQALQLQESTSSKQNIVRILRLLMTTILHKPPPQDRERVEAYGERALAICEELQDVAERSVVLNELARYHRVCGNLEKAEALAQESLELLQKTGDLYSQGRVMYQLSRIYEDRRDYHKALDVGETSMSIFDDLQNVYHSALLREHVGDLYMALERFDEAESIWRTGLGMTSSLQYERLERSFTERLTKVHNRQTNP